MINKIYIFQFVNTYISNFVYIFFFQDFKHLQINLIIIMFFKQFIVVLVEYLRLKCKIGRGINKIEKIFKDRRDKLDLSEFSQKEDRVLFEDLNMHEQIEK